MTVQPGNPPWKGPGRGRGLRPDVTPLASQTLPLSNRRQCNSNSPLHTECTPRDEIPRSPPDCYTWQSPALAARDWECSKHGPSYTPGLAGTIARAKCLSIGTPHAEKAHLQTWYSARESVVQYSVETTRQGAGAPPRRHSICFPDASIVEPLAVQLGVPAQPAHRMHTPR